MKTSMKLFLSFLLFYEPVAYFILSDDSRNGLCLDWFSSEFCRLDARFFLLMGVPILFMVMYLMWEKQIKSIFLKNNKKNNNSNFVRPVLAIKHFFSDAFVFGGASTRSEYWWVVLFEFILFFICFYFSSYEGIILLLFLFEVPNLSLVVRRWNDIGWKGKDMVWFSLVPELSFVVGIVNYLFGESPYPLAYLVGVLYGIFRIFKAIMFCLPSKIDNNPYRERPKYLDKPKGSFWDDDDDD